MAVFIQQPDALDLLTQVEGPDWRAKQTAGNFGSCSFNAFLQEWRTAQELATEEDKASEWFKTYSLVVDGNSAIYGSNGYNRYAVKYTGEIVFLRYQAWSEEAVKKAEAAGFRIFP